MIQGGISWWGAVGERLTSWAYKHLLLAASGYCPKMQDNAHFPRQFRNSIYLKSSYFKKEGK